MNVLFQQNLSKQSGLSLLELMISLTIGLLLLLGLTGVYTLATKATNQNEFIVATDETARQVFGRFARDFEQAGYIDPGDAPKTAFTGDASKGTVAGCTVPIGTVYATLTANNNEKETIHIYRRYKDSAVDNKLLTPIGKISCGGMQPVVGCAKVFDGDPKIDSAAKCKSTGEGQSIEISYHAMKASDDKFSNLPSEAYDCGGRKTNATPQNGFIINRYFLEEDNSVKSIKCQSNVGAKVTLERGVQEMTFRYLITSQEKKPKQELFNTESGRVVTNYYTPTQVHAMAANTLGWAAVVGVEVCLIISTPLTDGSQIASLAAAQGKQRPTCERKANGKFEDLKDKEDANKFYSRHSKTFSLPNALYLSP